MSIENPLWGAPRIHGELLKLGFEVAQSTVAKYMAKRPGLPSQGWRTFLRNHAPDIAAMDLFVVPTIGFDLLYAFEEARKIVDNKVEGPRKLKIPSEHNAAMRRSSDARAMALLFAVDDAYRPHV